MSVVMIDPLSSSQRGVLPACGASVYISISHETRSQPPKRNIIISLFTNQDLISCLHLLVNDTLSDKEFSLNSSTKADIYISYLNVKVNGFQVKMWCNIFLTSVIIAKDFSAVRQIRRQGVETFY